MSLGTINVGELVTLSGTFTPAAGYSAVTSCQIRITSGAGNGATETLAPPVTAGAWTVDWTPTADFAGPCAVTVQGYVSGQSVEAKQSEITVRALRA
jgi:hypothetical protein